MKRNFALRGLMSVLALTSFAWAQQAPAPNPQGVEGNWMGTLQAGVSKLRLGLQLGRNPQGDLVGVLESLDQNTKGIPVQSVTFRDNNLHLDIAAAGAQFDGALSEDGKELTGIFTQGTARRLIFTRVDKIALPVRSQEPKPPFPYRAGEVSYDSGAARLTGTLTLPSGAGPFPAVVLISGSGPQDRDETMAGHKPFWVIADYLTRRGIAVLRVDDRGTGQSTGSSVAQSFDSMADDVLAGVEYLKTRSDVDPKRIGVIGHSEGGMVGPLAASRSSAIAFVVMLAGPGVTGEELLSAQGDLVARAGGTAEPIVALNRAIQTMTFRVLREESDPNRAMQKMTEEWQKIKAALPASQKTMLDAAGIDAALAIQFRQSNSPELRAIVLSNPAETLRKVKVPVLAITGDRDIQVPAEQNLPAIAAALREAGNSDVTATALPGLNHLFQKCSTCQVAEYGDLDETFSPAALAALGDWLIAHTKTQ